MNEIEKAPEMNKKQKVVKGLKTIGRTVKNGFVKVGGIIKEDFKKTGRKIKQKWSDFRKSQETISDLRNKIEELEAQLTKINTTPLD